MKKKRETVLAVLCAMSIGFSVAGCASTVKETNVPENSALARSSESTSEQEGASASVSQETPDPHEYDTVIETNYGNLYFPDQWQEFLDTNQTEGDGAIAVSFSANINDKEYSLFTITIGSEEDNPAGTLTASDGTQRNVYVQIEELPVDDALSELEQNRLYAMQEDINYLLDSLE